MRNWQKRAATGVIVVAIGALALTACTQSSTANDQQATNNQLNVYQANQPIPKADWSQYRQTVIDVEQAQIHGMATTTFEFNMGVADPIQVCPSIGFPVASTSQMTNPQQAVGSGAVVAQAEPNGVFTGESSGTYIVCVAPDGAKYVDYWEGHVKTIGAPAHWDSVKKTIVLDGTPTVTANTKK